MLQLIILIPLSFTIPTLFAWKVFEKAGEPGWKTAIPFYNLYVWLRIIKKPMWWYIFLIIPFINVFVYLLMIIEMLKCFNKYSLGQQALAVLFPFVYMPWLGLTEKEKYLDPDKRPKRKKGIVREWVDAILFAVIAATIIRTFLLEAYTIPTSSMEKSLLVGDYLFVSKLSYGPRLPLTPLSFPFVHHTMPLSKDRKSYLEWVRFPYYRFPGLGQVERNDAVVFNYPAGDTLSTAFQSERNYYELVRTFGRKSVHTNPYQFGNIITRPVDKRENYIKRCIGMPGDTLQIIKQDIFINGEINKNPGKKQYQYIIQTNGSRINPVRLQNMGIQSDGDPLNPRMLDYMGVDQNEFKGSNPMLFNFNLTDESAEKIKQLPNVIKLMKYIYPEKFFYTEIYPQDTAYPWNPDWFGPIYIPKKGDTLELNMKNIALYERVIHAYEKNELDIRNNKIFINGKETEEYVIQMNYYWMMGDNRHNSQDSRFWGFVPEDHIVGKAVFVWLSLDKNKSLFRGKIRWNKMFRFVR